MLGQWCAQSKRGAAWGNDIDLLSTPTNDSRKTKQPHSSSAADHRKLTCVKRRRKMNNTRSMEQQQRTLQLDGTKIQLSRFQKQNNNAKAKETNAAITAANSRRLRFLNASAKEVQPKSAAPSSNYPGAVSLREELSLKKPALVVCSEDVCSERVKRLKETLQGFQQEEEIIRFLGGGAKFNTRAHEGLKCKRNGNENRNGNIKKAETRVAQIYTEFFGQHYQFLNRLIQQQQEETS